MQKVVHLPEGCVSFVYMLYTTEQERERESGSVLSVCPSKKLAGRQLECVSISARATATFAALLALDPLS